MVGATWSPKGGVLAFIVTASLAASLSNIWRQRINSTVLTPYLDEVFHVRQAQAYWQGHWRQWDPKITTPPGLYVFSYLLMALGVYIVPSMIDGSTSDLRATNGLIIFNAFQLRLRRLLGKLRREHKASKICMWELHWTALNICLFPPIFFFSGLYYTDIAALLFVIEAYWQDMKYGFAEGASKSLHFIVVGLLSLTFRQTNIIWAVVFIGGLKALRTVKSSSLECRSSDLSRIWQASWELGQLYDPPAENASVAGTFILTMQHLRGRRLTKTDYFKFGLSVVVNGLLNIWPIIKATTPHLVVLAAFGVFVLWNGSIVLGRSLLR
ncbi:glucosyltransferase [Ascosphaera aggregata]|nr:glucosyltransferase [Ascosphaera aggregata]